MVDPSATLRDRHELIHLLHSNCSTITRPTVQRSIPTTTLALSPSPALSPAALPARARPPRLPAHGSPTLSHRDADATDDIHSASSYSVSPSSRSMTSVMPSSLGGGAWSAASRPWRLAAHARATLRQSPARSRTAAAVAAAGERCGVGVVEESVRRRVSHPSLAATLAASALARPSSRAVASLVPTTRRTPRLNARSFSASCVPQLARAPSTSSSIRSSDSMESQFEL